jgi:uncharacterized protein (DUF488 family)
MTDGIMVTLYTIGFTQTSAEHFFERLRVAGIRRLVDVRRNNTSTLAGFSKKDDLEYFLRQILDVEYVHEPLLAPSDDLLQRYRKKTTSWEEYTPELLGQLAERQVESVLERSAFETPTVMLCSEPTAERCHRRLVVEYLAERWENVEIIHL